MKQLFDLNHHEAKKHFLKPSSYFNADLPSYISFAPILEKVSSILGEKTYRDFKDKNPNKFSSVNYSLISNKDGRLAWRPYELIHPVIYVSLVNTICSEPNWTLITQRMRDFKNGIVECCSTPMISLNHQTNTETQILNWWQKIEQKSIIHSLEYNHVIHTDVTDCYGSLYTHSIPWALHDISFIKNEANKRDSKLLGNKIDAHIQASRYGQTNGISQGSVLMDFIAEIVLGYVDTLINSELDGRSDFKILRYRDDYRIFANSDERAEDVLKVISDKLRVVGMRLGTAKTFSSKNVVEGSIKPDKLSAIELQDLGVSNAKTIQKQLLRLHTFGQRHPNSGALRRLLGDFHTKISTQTEAPDDLEVQIAIATDIAFVSPSTFPAIAGILSYLISLAPAEQKSGYWEKVRRKMARIPYNGYLEIWLQRVITPKPLNIAFNSDELICQIVSKTTPTPELWESNWISSPALKQALDPKEIVIADPQDMSEVVTPEEVELFTRNAYFY